jgi:RND superfamily putative drug exporter
MGAAVSIVVAVAVAAAVTLLPALLRLMGAHIDKLRVPLAFRDDGERWQRWTERVARRPIASLVFGLVALTALASPVLGMRLGVLDDEMSSPESTQHIAYEWIREGFGSGANGPLVVVVSPASAAKITAEKLINDVAVLAVLPTVTNKDGTLALVTVIPVSAPQDPATTRLVHRLRKDVMPALAKTTGATFAVGGLTPLTIDLDEAVGARLPLVIAAVLLASFVLLLAVFRALLVSLKAVVLNLLSIGAAYGVVVIVFQHGVGLSLLGLAHPVPIVSFLPLLMFAVLFGLSMDYEVFMLTRVREEHARGASSIESVSRGIAKTARVVTSAALVMVSVFVAFALGHDPLLKMFGVGLASAVALDASIVRLLLVPASMVLLGDKNWWLPFSRKSAPTRSPAREGASRSSA